MACSFLCFSPTTDMYNAVYIIVPHGLYECSQVGYIQASLLTTGMYTTEYILPTNTLPFSGMQSIFYQPILYQGCSLGFSIKMFLCPINAFPPVRLFRWGKKKTPDEILGAAISIYCTSHELQGIFWLGGNKKINLDFLVRHSLGAVADIICCSILMCTDKASLMQAPTMRRRDRTRGLAAFFSLVSNVTSLAESFPSCWCNIHQSHSILCML